jgi:NTE family protein
LSGVAIFGFGAVFLQLTQRASCMNKINPLNPAQLRIVLVLQGGGALGAYQALHEHNLVPDWIVGTSIGAINAALIAGNEQANRLQRVKAFWDRVSHPDG